MSETSLSPAPTCIFEDCVDLGSWTDFTLSLARFLDEVCRSSAQQGGSTETAIDPFGDILLLITPFPMIKPEGLASQKRRSQLLTRLSLVTPPIPFPDLPSVVLIGRPDGVEVSLPELDAQGRVLLGLTERRVLGVIGWQENHRVFARLLSDADKIIDPVTRTLTEVLGVAHPADLDHLLYTHSNIS